LINVVYNASRTLSHFHLSDAFYRGIMGPVGSGKSTGCCMEIMRRIKEQRSGPDGIRRSRWVIIRNTYRELEDTTKKTWLDWFPTDHYGPFNNNDMTHHVAFGDVEADVLFRALDRPADVKKLLSLELTGGWVNEARETPKAVIDALGDRVERYPAAKDGGCSWAGVILDTNPPDDDHWWYTLAEEETPEGWAFFRQPGGVLEVGGKFHINPKAENLKNLPKDYYKRRMGGKTNDYIRVYYASEYGYVQDGRPVYPEYSDQLHCAAEPFGPQKGIPIVVGLDFGLTPAALFGQRLPSGKWIVFDELPMEGIGTESFAKLLGPMLRGTYAGFEFEIYGDPAGRDKHETSEKCSFEILEAHGIPAMPAAPNNNYTRRREAAALPFTRIVDGEPGVTISPKCKVFRKGMKGGYQYKRVQIAGDARYKDAPDKNKYSHICEAGQYMFLGAGEGDELVKTGNMQVHTINRRAHAPARRRR